MLTIESSPKTEFLNKLLEELSQKTFALLQAMPDAFKERSDKIHREIENKIRLQIETLNARRAQLPREFSELNTKKIEQASSLFLQQLQHFLDKQSRDPQADIELLAAQVKTLFNNSVTSMLLTECERKFWENFLPEFIRKQEREELEYAKQCYRELDLPAVTNKIYNCLNAPYEVKHDGDIILNKPVIYDTFPCFSVGRIRLSRKSENRFVTDFQRSSFPFLLPRSGVNIVSYDQGSPIQTTKDSINGLISNILYQTLLFQLPNIKVMIWEGNNLFNSYDGLLPQQDKLKDFISIYSSFHTFRAEVEKAIAAQPSNIAKARRNIKNQAYNYIYIIGMLPPVKENDRTLNDYLELMENVASRKEAGVSALFVTEESVFTAMQELREFHYSLAAATYYSLEKGIDLKNLPALEKFSKSENLTISVPELDPAWDDLENSNFKTNILKAIISPPREQRAGEVRLFFAEQANGDPFNFIYDKENANTIFLTGSPGSGKSVAMKFFIRNACENYSPEELQLILVDLKGGVEMIPFAKLPHSQFVVSASTRVLQGIFNDLTAVMSERQALFVSVASNHQKICANLDQYNDLVRSGEIEGKVQPRLLVIVDECKTLFADNNRSLRQALEELLRKGRAAGIHFFFATQTDERSQFGKELFNYRIQMTVLNGRRTTTLFQGSSDEGNVLNIPRISTEEEEFGPARIARIADKYPAFAANAIILKTFPQTTLQDFPAFKSEFRKIKSAESDEIKFISGIDFNALRSLFTISFNRFSSQHLFIAGEAGIRNDNTAVCKELDGFVNLMFISLLSQDCRISLYDPENKFEFLTTTLSSQKCSKFSRTSDPREFAGMVAEWKKDADGQGNGKHFLFIASAELFFKDMTEESTTSRENKFSSFASAFSKPAQPEKPTIAAGDWDALFSNPAPAASAAVTESDSILPSEPQPESIAYEETGKILKQYWGKNSENQTYIILQTAYPKGVLEDNIRSENFKNFRYTVFPSVISASSRMERPENIMAYFSKSPNNDDNKEIFVPFDKFNAGELL